METKRVKKNVESRNTVSDVVCKLWQSASDGLFNVASSLSSQVVRVLCHQKVRKEHYCPVLVPVNEIKKKKQGLGVPEHESWVIQVYERRLLKPLLRGF